MYRIYIHDCPADKIDEMEHNCLSFAAKNDYKLLDLIEQAMNEGYSVTVGHEDEDKNRG